MTRPPTAEVVTGDALTELRRLPDNHVHCVVTSPPYWGLRDYGMDGQLGREPTIEAHVGALVEVFHEVRRVLRNDGTLWLNYGDTYREKRLLGMPWRVAFALDADGWWLRSDIIWHKRDPLPGTASDRPARAHEYVFLFAAGREYFYDADAVRRPARLTPPLRGLRLRGPGRRVGSRAQDLVASMDFRPRRDLPGGYQPHLRTVWALANRSAAPLGNVHAHAGFAAFPPALVQPCIRAGTPAGGVCARCGAFPKRPPRRLARDWGDGEDPPAPVPPKPSCGCGAGWAPGLVLDPFAGSATAGLVALREGRSFVGIEINAEYAASARARLAADSPLFTSPKGEFDDMER